MRACSYFRRAASRIAGGHADARRRSRRDVDLRLCALTVGAAEDVLALGQQAAFLKGRVYDAPAWLKADAAETERYMAPRLAALEREEARLREGLAALHAGTICTRRLATPAGCNG